MAPLLHQGMAPMSRGISLRTVKFERTASQMYPQKHGSLTKRRLRV